jgi:hypothetical protein
MSSEEIKDFEKKIIQTFALGQPALVKVVLDAYSSLISSFAFQEGLFCACESLKLRKEFQVFITSYIRYSYKEY